jgi:uncharacterized protein with GYD domain
MLDALIHQPSGSGVLGSSAKKGPYLAHSGDALCFCREYAAFLTNTREVPKVAFYLMRFTYTPETWSKLMQNPEDRRDAARAYIEVVGGTLHGFWYGFGQYDGYAIFEAPDNVSITGVVLAITAGGALASVETTVLMTVEEMLEALAKGKDIGYRRPGESPAT